MPIPRLQRLGRGEEDRFLYQYNWPADVRRATVSAYQEGASDAFSNVLWLQPGVAEALRGLNGLLRPLFSREWAITVAKLNSLPEAGLESFLFDVDRASLDPVRKSLRELHDNRCFYCDDRIKRVRSTSGPFACCPVRTGDRDEGLSSPCHATPGKKSTTIPLRVTSPVTALRHTPR